MSIQQHALPQDVTGYKFRLVGDMTLKQFLMLAISIIICVLFYGSPLPFFFRIPLAAIFLLLGIGLAFVPVQGRPLDQWLIAFFKSIYSPTQYRWEDRAKSISPTTAPISTQPSTPTPPVTPPPVPVPTQVPTPAPIPVPLVTPVAPINPIAPVSPQPSPITPPPTSTVSTPTPSTPPIIPQPLPVSTPTPIPAPIPTPPIQNPQLTTLIPVTTPTSNPLSNLPIPFTPTTPNTIVGLTLNSENKIVDGVLIEIKTNGLTVRATKSNKLGQFMFARPLENGLYQISAEKPDLTFDTYSLNLHGQIVNPLKIQTKS